MATAIDRLKVQGGPAPRNGVLSSTTARVTFKANKPTHSNITELEKSYQFILKQDKTSDLMLKGINHLSVQARKSRHLSRIQEANLGISTMDSLNISEDTDVVIEKPHFVLCGLPMGSKTVDPQLYLHEARVGNYKTSARELNRVKRGNKSGKAYSEPTPSSRDNEVNGSRAFSLALDDLDSMPVLSTPAMVPPLTPTNSAITNKRLGRESAKSYLDIKGSKGLINSQHNAWNVFPSQEFVLFSHHKKQPCLVDRANDQNNEIKDSLDTKPQKSDVNSRSTVDSITKQISEQQKRPKYAKPFVRRGVKINFNNPYRNFKHKERQALVNKDRYEFTSIEGYMTFNRQIKQTYGRDTIVPRSIIRVPNPCSDTFLLQMMYELNRPKSRRSLGGSSTPKQSDIAVQKDLEDLVQSTTSSSLSKTNSSIDKYQSQYKSAVSANDNMDETIEEEIARKNKDI
ncbi:hypothetical protein CHS0354_016793 [Potamilus streckersoni]|uniref:Uncharacterized protein n=1 Tax=Potamilus streckersoni TaxID=2493646 RepID=A0AAE0T4B3_9BIVA|nr:hypothetical protein CHS0354_016793 [Potamilus streckersoni]